MVSKKVYVFAVILFYLISTVVVIALTLSLPNHSPCYGNSCVQILYFDSTVFKENEKFKSTAEIGCALFLSVALIVYFLSKSYQTVHGKCEICLLFGIFLVYFSQTLEELSSIAYQVIMAASFVYTYLWASVLCFDVWWDLKKNLRTEDKSKRFKFYWLFAFGLTGIFPILDILSIFFTITGHRFNDILSNVLVIVSAILVIITFTDFFMLASTGMKIRKNPQNSNTEDHAWFEEQQTRQEWKFSWKFIK